MQSKNISFEQLIKSSAKIREKINKEYFQPFLESLKESGLNEVEFIQEAFRYLQCNEASSHIIKGYPRDLPDVYSDFDFKSRREYFKKQLLHYANLDYNFKKLSFIYLDPNKQQQEFPELTTPNIQTCIREIFHDYLDPLPELNIKTLGSNSLSPETIK